jgi:hypothetical protein
MEPFVIEDFTQGFEKVCPFRRANAGGGSGGGSPSGGGGGGSGAVSYPAYMQDWHTIQLASISTCMATAQAASPYTGLAAYNPDTNLGAIDTAVGLFKTAYETIDSHDSYTTVSTDAGATANTVFGASVISTIAQDIDDHIASSAVASTATQTFSDILDEEYSGKITPAFEGGMRDINSIMSSAFILGTSLLATERANKVAKFTSDILIQDHNNRGSQILTLVQKRSDFVNQAVSEMLRLFVQKIEFTRTYAALISDTKRLAIAAKNDQQLEDKAIDVMDGKWDLETFQYGANLLASIGGGTAQPSRMEGSQMARIVGGGLSGAAAGSLIGSRVSDGGGGDYSGMGALLGGIGGLLAGS